MNIGILIGRFSPLHLGHEAVVRKMLSEQHVVIILIGSSYQTPNTRSPFSINERIEMFESVFSEKEQDQLFFKGIKDYPYNETKWQYAIQEAVESFKPIIKEWPIDLYKKFNITLYGFNKDETSYYLQMFPQWNRIDHDPILLANQLYNATDVRKELYTSVTLGSCAKAECSQPIQTWLENWSLSEKAKWLRKEYEYEQNYKGQYLNLPYPPIFQTVDNIVFWRGLVLMIQRKHRPGMGLWALPGGFLNANETKRAGAERELLEETHIEIYRQTKNGSKRIPIDPTWIQQIRSFDYPLRSQRGRTITEGYLWRIPDNLEVTHKADDDAAKSKFIPLNTILNNMNEIIFEDHQAIIAEMCLRN
jgi:bifunctional NMN adenylyltransferase/nudix hydrolase